MRWTTITSQTTSDQWFHDYVSLALSNRPVGLPPLSQALGSTKVTWFETEPGVAFIDSHGGTVDDRSLAMSVVSARLREAGYRQAEFSFDWEKGDPLRKTADWDDVEEKAKALRDEGRVNIERNGQQEIVGTVNSFSGNTYQTQIWRQDPNSRTITLWECDCPWDQFAWQRTRQWKKYEGRPCAHVLATYWKAEATPLDQEYDAQTGQPVQQGQGLFQMGVGGQPGGGLGWSWGSPPTGGGGQSPFIPRGPRQTPAPQDMQQQMMIPGVMPGMATGTPPQYAPGVIPPFPDPQPDPATMPNPASVPGLRQPGPTNPVQYPGGTFSKVAAPITTVQNGDMVQTRFDDEGEWVGRMEAWSEGPVAHIPQGSVGEVLGTDPTGMINVLFMNPAIGVQEHGKMQPFGASAWFFPSQLIHRPDIKKPGPAIQRTRAR